MTKFYYKNGFEVMDGDIVEHFKTEVRYRVMTDYVEGETYHYLIHKDECGNENISDFSEYKFIKRYYDDKIDNIATNFINLMVRTGGEYNDIFNNMVSQLEYIRNEIRQKEIKDYKDRVDSK